MDRLEKALEKARKEAALAAPFVMQTKRPVAVDAAITPVSSLGPLVSGPTVAVDEALLDANRIIAPRTRSAEADVFRILRTQVLHIMNKSNLKTLAITSPDYGDGKTTVALNLALSIALDSKQTVLLADLDLRKPNLHEYLGLEPSVGLGDYLLGEATIPDCLQRLSFNRMSVLPGGRSLDNSSEFLGSPKMAALAQEMKHRYADRLVIYDMPPTLEQDDVIAFLPNVDAVLVVFREGVTKTDDVIRCLQTLANANVIGTVLNCSNCA